MVQILKNCLNFCSRSAVLLLLGTAGAHAHPHVFLEANLELVRNQEGFVTELRHVWRFDDIFSSSLILDFDENGNGELDIAELQEIANITKSSLSEYEFYTHVMKDGSDVKLQEPDPFYVDFQDGPLIMIMSIALEKPQSIGKTGFKVSVSDDTYYTAVEFNNEKSIDINGTKGGCSWEIIRPDFDALYARDAERLADLFDAGPDDKVEGSDDYLTWVEFSCPN